RRSRLARRRAVPRCMARGRHARADPVSGRQRRAGGGAHADRARRPQLAGWRMSVFDRAAHIVIATDEAALAEAAATRLAARTTAVGGARICLTGGRTPQALYRLLARPPWRDRIAWHNTHWFVGDERFVPADDALSNMGMARALFLDQCAAPGTVHPVATDAAGPDQAAHAYEAMLQALYGAQRLDDEQPLFDLVLMGI